MKLIKELSEDVEYIEEENSKRMYVQGVIMQHSVENGNRRIYPREVMMNEVNRYISERINSRNAYGELGHPNTPKIDPERISHRFVELKEDGNNIIGKALVSSTDKGEIVRGLINDGGRLGISSRGMGSLKEQDGRKIVQDDFHLNTAGDIVIDPSAPDAYIQGVMESKEWVWDNGIIVESEVADHKKQIEKASRQNLEERMYSVFDDFLKKLSKR